MSQIPDMFSLLADHFESVTPTDRMDFGIENWHETLKAANNGGSLSDALRIVTAILPKLEPIELSVATTLLADGSRYEPWRLPFGEYGILDFYLDHLVGGQTQSVWTSDILRLIGNTCADLEVNRERIIAKVDFDALINRLRYDKQVDLAIVVLNNLCSEYEPGEEAARNHQLFPAIIHMLGRNAFNPGLFDQICDLLASSSGSFNPILCPDNAVAILCTAIRTPNLEVGNQVSLGTAIVALLKHEHFQRLAIMQDDVISILALIVFSCTQDPAEVTEAAELIDLSLVHKEQEIEDEELLSSMRLSLSSSLWDLSSLPEFATKYFLNPHCNPYCLSVLFSWLQTSVPQMQLCACYVFRNLASSDKACGILVQESKVHIPLINILKSSSDLPVLGETLRLLKNLALPTENKPLIGSGTAADSITGCWARLASPTLHQAAVGLFRSLLRGCPSNIIHFLGLQSTRDDFSASSDGSLFHLWSLYQTSTDLAIKVEVSRTVVEIWRTAHKEVPESVSSITEGTIDQARRMHANIAEPVVLMVVESNNASLVTEGWFGLTLIASSKDGCGMVSEALSGQKAWDILVRAVTSPEVRPENRANSRALLDKLRKSGDRAALGILETIL